MKLQSVGYYIKKSFQVFLWPFRAFLYGEIHPSTQLHLVHRIPRPRYVRLGRDVVILINARIEAVIRYNDICFTPNIHIEDRVTIQQNLHLTCAKSIHVGKNTAIGANVTITDINHAYEDIEKAVEHQNLEVSCVDIGDDCKIYNNAVILPGVKIGKHCVIGANSVVNRSIPDYSVAVGIPAKVVKRYNFSTQNWERI